MSLTIPTALLLEDRWKVSATMILLLFQTTMPSTLGCLHSTVRLADTYHLINGTQVFFVFQLAFLLLIAGMDSVWI
jgi:hypothetical protein